MLLLRIRFRRRVGQAGARHTTGHPVGGHPRQLDLSGLRCLEIRLHGAHGRLIASRSRPIVSTGLSPVGAGSPVIALASHTTAGIPTMTAPTGTAS